MEWPVSKTMEHFYFLREWYKMRYGDPDEVDDKPGNMGGNINTPSMPSKLKNKMSSSSKAKMDAMKNQGKQVRSGRGASGHTYKFKKPDS